MDIPFYYKITYLVIKDKKLQKHIKIYKNIQINANNNPQYSVNTMGNFIEATRYRAYNVVIDI